MNYKFLNVPLGMDLNSQDHKHFWGSLIAAGASLLGNFLGNEQQSGITKEQQKLQSILNREEQTHSMSLQRDYQNMLWDQGAAKSVAGLKNAGLNPATAGGTAVGGAGGSVAHPSSGASGPGASKGPSYGSDAVAAAMQAKQVENDTKVADAQSEALLAQAEKDRQSAAGQKNVNDNFAQTYAAEMEKMRSESNRNNAYAEESRSHAMLYGKQAASEEVRRDNLIKEGEKISAETSSIRQEIRNKMSLEKLSEAQRYELFARLKSDLRTAFMQRLHLRESIANEYVDTWCNYLRAETEAESAHYKNQLARQEAYFNEHYRPHEERIKVARGYAGLAGDIILGVVTGSYGGKIAAAGKKFLKGSK